MSEHERYDWQKESDPLLAELKYIADSPAQEHGGFHPRVVAAAQGALAEIGRLKTERDGLLQCIERALWENKS